MKMHEFYCDKCKKEINKIWDKYYVLCQDCGNKIEKEYPQKYEVHIHGDVIGSEEWVENVLVPVLKGTTYEWGWKLRYFNWEENPEEAKDIWGLM